MRLATCYLVRMYRWAQAFFALFALGFFATRVFINSAVTLLFLREVGRGVLGGRSELTFSAPVRLLLSVAEP